MKKSVKFIALALALLSVMLVFASCAKKVKGGSYEGPTATFTFKGGKVDVKGLTGSASGKYEIKDGKITITLEEYEGGSISEAAMKVYDGSFNYEETDAGIKIGGVEYKKK